MKAALALALALAFLGACPSGGDDPVDARPSVDAPEVDAPPLDAAPDAPVDAPMINCDDLDVGPMATYDELVETPRAGDQSELLAAWSGTFIQLVWKEADGVMTIRNSVTATYLNPARRIAPATATPTTMGCMETGECMIALRDPLGFVRLDSGSNLTDPNPVTNAAFREIAAVGGRSGQYMIIYRDAATSGWRVQRYNRVGNQPLDATPRQLPPLSDGKPQIAGCDGAGCLIVYPGVGPDSGRLRVPWTGAVGAIAPPPGPWDRVACNQSTCLWAASGAGFITDTATGSPAPIALPTGKIVALAAAGTSFGLVVQSTVVPTRWTAHRVTNGGVVTDAGELPGATWVEATVGCGEAMCSAFAREPSALESGAHDIGIARFEQTVLESHIKFVIGANAQTDARAASNGAVQLVAWIDHREDGVRWRVARHDPAGTWLDLQARELPIPDVTPPSEVALTWTGHDFLFSWVGTAPSRALRAVRIAPDGTIDAAPTELVPGAFRHAIACTQDVCLVVTAEAGAGGAEHRLRRTDATTLASLGPAVQLRTGVTLSPVLAAATSDRFALALEGAGGANQLTRVAVDGTLLDAPPITVPDAQLHALVGRDGGFGLATSAVIGGGGSLRLVGATLGNRIALPPEATAPALASLGADLAAAWRYPDTLAARRFDATGPISATKIVGGPTAEHWALAAGPPGELLAAWTEHDPAPDLAARRLRVRRICGH